MSAVQPLPTRLHDGASALVLVNQPVFSTPDGKHQLSPGLPQNAVIAVVGTPTVSASERWWRVRMQGESGIAWTRECDANRYYLAPANGSAAADRIYVVRPGDSWSKIAAQFGTTVQALKRANPGLIRPHDIIHPGDRMRIPA